MDITMLSTQQGSVDGIQIQEYTEGVEYSLGATPGQLDLAQAFLAAGMAVERGEDGVEAAQPAAAKKPKAPK